MRVVLLLAGLLLSNALVAAERVIELSDGSKIRGDVISMQNDTFTVRTATLGTITIKAAQIVNMTTPGSKVEAAKKPEATSSGALTSIQSSIAGNATLMTDIMRLQNDPQMKAILADPALMKAVQDLDFSTLEKDPRIQALMNNPNVKQIQSGVH